MNFECTMWHFAFNAKSFGKRVMPGYDLAKADVLVGVDADFLATWAPPPWPAGSTPPAASPRNPMA